MPFEVELFCLGLATVVDFVLLIVVLESGNRRLTAIWLKWALAGTALWHAGCFAHTALYETTGTPANQLDLIAMTVMSAGLLTITSGILHAALRIHRSGSETHPKTDPRYIILYAPVLFTALVAWRLADTADRSFVLATRPFHGLYLLWLSLANGSCVWLFLKNRHRLSRRISGARFLLRFSLGLAAVTLLTCFYLFRIHQSDQDLAVLRLLTTLCPIVPALIFAYYISRRRLIPLVFERTLVYAAILLSVFYLHRLTISPLMQKYGAKFQFDFVLLEGSLLIALVLAYRPLRGRVNEGLRYLVGRDVEQYRDRIRGLSVQLSQRSNHPSADLLYWFASELRQSLHLQFVEIFMSEPEQRSLRSTGDIAPDFEDRNNDAKLIEEQRNQLITIVDGWIDRQRFSSDTEAELLYCLDLTAAYPVRDQNVRGCLFLGATISGDRLSQEQIQATCLLIDQLASVLQNQHLQRQKRSAERLAVQQEKLSVLGLLSGSIAHEVKNPLSSIRTIATLMKEDLNEDDEHIRDLDLIVSEIDRLAQTTGQLLDFARPDGQDAKSSNVANVIDCIVQILGHLARKHTVNLEVQIPNEQLDVAVGRASVTDILLNLIKNAIEATATCDIRCVRIQADAVQLLNLKHVTEGRPAQFGHTANTGDNVPDAPHASGNGSRFVRIIVEDSGPGIPDAKRKQMFEPFVTSKIGGTGLGLYLVAERLKEIGGDVQCTSGPNSGTQFRVLLPVDDSSEGAGKV